MRRFAFVIVLFLMASASLILGLIQGSLGWFIGGVVLLAPALYARKRLRDEAGSERTAPSSSFAITAMAVSVVLVVFLLWLGSR
ncbi:MAG: hypothetical protein ABIR54_00165 [Burkholderiaceae bacterium]